MKVRATFVGEDGSMGYANGQTYNLVIEGNTIRWPHPCPYTVEGFLANWRLVDQGETDA